MGSSTLHFPCVAPQLGDSLDPLLVSHGKKLYEIVMCVLFQIHVVLFPCFERSGAFFGK